MKKERDSLKEIQIKLIQKKEIKMTLIMMNKKIYIKQIINHLNL